MPKFEYLWLKECLREYKHRMDAREKLRASMEAEELESLSERDRRVQELICGHHPKQAAATNDPGRLIAVLGTRRSGKSRGFLRRLVYDAVNIPNSYQIYINTSWPECRRIAWRGAGNKDGVEPLNREFGLGAAPNRSDHTWTFPGGGVIEMIGADNIPAIERALGIGPHRVWIDESQKMPHLDHLVMSVLGPAMADFDGQIVLTGTPSIDCSGLFYEVTRDDSELCGEEQWHVHKLNVLDNPFFGATKRERYERTIKRHCQKFNLKEDDPEVQRDWFGKWVVDGANFVYHVLRVPEDDLCYADMRWLLPPRLDKRGHLLGGTPDVLGCLSDLPRRQDGSQRSWFFGFGSDLGYSPDPFAYVLWAWSYELPELYEVCSWKEVELTSDMQNAVIQDLMYEKQIPFAFMKADAAGGGKSVVKGWAEGWIDRYALPIDEAKKSQKATFIELLNNDIRGGKVKLRRNSPLHIEMQKLTWTTPRGNAHRVEDVRRDKFGRKRNPNDCCDAALYAFREAQHHRYTEIEAEPLYGTAEYWEREEREIEQQLLDMIEAGGHVH